MSANALRHALALTIAVLLVFGVRFQDRRLGTIGRRTVPPSFFKTYTPYFPGFSNLRTHEIFDPANNSTKKIVLLGASAIESIGCDYTWHRPAKNQEPNADFSCSIAAQMNGILHKMNLGQWQVFSLARSGAKLTDMLYVYSQIAALKPEVVVFGDTFNYYMWDNAGADDLNKNYYAAMDLFYGKDSRTAGIWQAYEANLRAHGWKDQISPPVTAETPAVQKDLSLEDLLVRSFIKLRHLALANGMPRPVALTKFRDWNPPNIGKHPFNNPDPNFGYFQGVQLIKLKQDEFGGKTFVYFSPRWDDSYDRSFVQGVNIDFGGYLRNHDILYSSLLEMRMHPMSETYDGSHQTLAGNHRIALALVDDLLKAGFVR